ncbi:hypothetical protein HOF65_04940 [bacterium]|jgi:hypothetical protein|nr:hypothetical protein [bacterium]
MNKITIELLDEVEPGFILAGGSFRDNGGTNIMNTGNKLRWVAIRGGINDFAIYFENIWSNDVESMLVYPKLGDWSDDQIKMYGDKLPKYMVRELVDIDDKALSRYRS